MISDSSPRGSSWRSAASEQVAMIHTSRRQADGAGLRHLGDNVKIDKENALLADRGGPLQSKLAESSASLRPHLTRKPLGNITNSASKTGDGAGENELKGKKAPAVRRAFGDITNSAPRPTKPAAQPDAKVRYAPLPVLKAAATSSRARVHQAAEDDVERPAGKGWDQLEVERLQEEESMIRQRVKKLTSLPMWQAPLGNLKGSASACSDTADRDDMELDLSPEPVVKPAGLSVNKWSGGLHASMSSVSPASLDLLTSPSPDCLSLSDLLMSSEEEDLLL